MPNQQSLYALCGEGVRELSRSPEEWLGFLRTACRNYRCPFPEQLLIYKQRPEATAVLELERWNALFGRWVNRGAQGIAVLDHSGDSVKIKYYFDIADTHPGAGAREVPLWTAREEYAQTMIAALEASFGPLEKSGSLADAIISASKRIAADNISDRL